MKNILFALLIPLFALTSVFAKAPYGELDDFDKPQHYRDYGVYKIITGRPIKYYLELEDGASILDYEDFEQYDNREGIKIDPLSRVAFEITAENALKFWPYETYRKIKEAGRMDEFADILPFLAAIKLQQVNSFKESDITFRFAPVSYIVSACGGGAKGCHSGNGRPSIITLPNPMMQENKDKKTLAGDWVKIKVEDNKWYNSALEVSLHEVGHYYALADQYNTVNASAIYSTSDRIGKDSIMSKGDKLSITCDDVDGFINIIDRSYYKVMGQYPARAQKGWKSFCDNTKFVNAKPQNKKKYKTEDCVYTYKKNGDIATKVCNTPFDFTGRQIVKDKNGFIVAAKDTAKGIVSGFDYYLDEQEPVIEAYTYFASDKDNIIGSFYITREQDTGYWSFRQNGISNSVLFDNNICQITAYGDANEFFEIGENNSLKSYTYSTELTRTMDERLGYKSILLDKKIPFSITRYDFAKDGFKCKFEISSYDIDGNKEWIFNYDKQNKFSSIQYPDKKNLNYFMNKYGVSAEDFEQAAKERCLMKVNYDLNNKIKTCQLIGMAEKQIKR